jgi:hypothetical protein
MQRRLRIWSLFLPPAEHSPLTACVQRDISPSQLALNYALTLRFKGIVTSEAI